MANSKQEARIKERKYYPEVYQRANGICENCGKPPDWRGMCIAHIPDRGSGGTTTVYVPDRSQPFHLEAHCYRCNPPSPRSKYREGNDE